MTRDKQVIWATECVQSKMGQLGLEYETWANVKDQIAELAGDAGFELDTAIFPDNKTFLSA